MLRHPCILGDPLRQARGAKLEVVPNKGEQNQKWLPHPWGGRVFVSGGGGGGSIEPSGRTPPSPKMGSIDRTPKILPSLTPRPWR